MRICRSPGSSQSRGGEGCGDGGTSLGSAKRLRRTDDDHLITERTSRRSVIGVDGG